MNGFSKSQVISLVLVVGVTGSAFAQNQSDRRRQFVQGLLKTFIESQLPSDNNPSTRPGQPRPNQPRPGQPRPGQPARPGQTVQPGAPRPAGTPANASRATTAEMREASRLLALASDEMQQLVGALQTDMYRAQGVRQLLSLAFNVNSDAAVLSRRLARGSADEESLRADLRQLDQDWRTLEYRLAQIPNLSRTTLGHLERIRQYETKLATMFQVQTQIDIAAVTEQALAMNSSLRSLLEDIRYEITDVTTANRLLQEGRDTYDRLQQFIRTTRRTTTYEEVKRDYKVLADAWALYERHLRGVSNRFVQRQMQRINGYSLSIGDLLYIEHAEQINMEDLVYATKLLQRDTDMLLRKVNLKMLSELPAARRFAIESAGDFGSACQDLLEVMEAGDDVEVIRDTFLYAHDEWQRLNLSLQGIGSQPARQALRDVERSVGTLQTQLGIQFDFNRSEATELAVSLVTGARHMQEDMRDFFSRPNRYPRDFQTGSLQAAADFQATSRKLHTDLTSAEKLRTLKTSCESMSAAWKQLDAYLPSFNSSERAHLNRIRREVTPLVVQMQTLLTL